MGCVGWGLEGGMERASGRVMGPVGGQHGGGIGGTLAVRGREWQHLAEYDFSEGGQPSRYIGL